LLTELDPYDPDLAFGLCDFGVGHPDLGTVSLTEIAGLRGRFGRRSRTIDGPIFSRL
jgi:hypothetical protein